MHLDLLEMCGLYYYLSDVSPGRNVKSYLCIAILSHYVRIPVHAQFYTSSPLEQGKCKVWELQLS